MDWTEVKIYTNSFGVEVLTAEFLGLGVSGFAIEDPKDFEDLVEGKSGRWDIIEEGLFDLADSEVNIRLYLPDNLQGRETFALICDRIGALKQTQEDLGRLAISLTNVCEEDWANSWKRYYKPLRIGEHIVIKPTWEQVTDIKEDDVVVELDPGMAFGTGSHETTSMCAKMLEKYLKPKDKVLDIGCGSGILSIIAAKLGASSVFGVDIDENSVRVAKENVEQNNEADKINICVGDLVSKTSGSYDVVIANIIADVIIELTGVVKPYIKQDGVFLVSGIINLRYDDVLAAFAQNSLSVVEEIKEGDWLCFVLKKGMSCHVCST